YPITVAFGVSQRVAWSSFSLSGPEGEPVEFVVSRTDWMRAAAGLAPLQWNNELAIAASDYAFYMASHSYFAHNTPEGTTPVSRSSAAGYPSFPWGTYVGENLAKGFDSPDTVMQGWMNSEGHRRNVLLPDYIEIGVAVAAAPDGTLYWAQEFGNRPAIYAEE
ncbi:MAG TPA: CAP domain-containing protein, partial [Chloroflexota bacterium]|nr:CAP domain-containing protein [Chloroflexota bacterium]